MRPFVLMELSQPAGAQTFVDVGVNIGLYSVFSSQAVGQIHACETNQKLSKEIGSNFSLNGIAGRVRCVAVSNHAGHVTFGVVSRYAGNSAVVADGADDKA